MLRRNVHAILGLVFSPIGGAMLVAAAIVAATARHGFVPALAIGPTGLVFGIVGVSLLSVGRRRGKAKLAALESGIAAEGEVTSVEQNLSVQINNRSPWVIRYRFNAGNQPTQGQTESYLLAPGERRVGDAVWVVFLPSDPSVNSVWPPLA